MNMMRAKPARQGMYLGAILLGVLAVIIAGSCGAGKLKIPHLTPGTATPSASDASSSHFASNGSEGSALNSRLVAAVRAKGPAYVPRTRHKNADGSPKYTNRLIFESSPYLLQHAHNPVNWFAWGDEAFERARVLHRPIFLSVGYSTCHWCHVMEEESFEDEEIARYLNAHYVAIKLDREERPDVDTVYMSFVQAFTGRGGWPMSVWTTPARDPFFGGTYFPPRVGVRDASQGFLELLQAQAAHFESDPNGVARRARSMVERLREATAPEPAGDLPSSSILDAARVEAERRFDPNFGGHRGAPKFPSSFPIRLLLRSSERSNDATARRMAIETLLAMRRGGIYDQIGGGFHRYSTDPRWLVPHFEKMLYDNALLALTYLEASQATGTANFWETTRDTLDYLLRDMTAPDGTFYSATDADSLTSTGRREEGIFFTWKLSELRSTLSPDDAALAAAWFGVDGSGNFEGRSILTMRRSLDDTAKAANIAPRSLELRLSGIARQLLQKRTMRPPPLRDEKVIVAWNALTVSAFARAALVSGEGRYAEAAARAARKLIGPLRDGLELPHLFISGAGQGKAFADDYASLANALLDVFELTCDTAWLRDATQLLDQLESAFADSANGGYFLTAGQHEQLLIRDKPNNDGPVPSANSMAALASLRLFAFTGDNRFRERAEKTVRALARTLSTQPLALDHMLLALDWMSAPVKQVVVVVPDRRGALSSEARPLLDVLRRVFPPNAVFVIATEDELRGDLGSRVVWGKEKTLRAGRATAYVCEQKTCKFPTNDPEVFAKQLWGSRPSR